MAFGVFACTTKGIDCKVSCLVQTGLQTAFLFIFSLCLFPSILFWLDSTCCLIRLVLIHSPSDWLNTGCLKSANMGCPDYMCLCVWLWEIWVFVWCHNVCVPAGVSVCVYTSEKKQLTSGNVTRRLAIVRYHKNTSRSYFVLK